MMPGEGVFRSFSPAFWYLVFTRETAVWWWRWVPGKFKHVTAIAPLPDLGVWVAVEAGYDRTHVGVVRDADVEKLFQGFSSPGAEIVRMPVLNGPSRVPRWGFWCTALAGHLVGLCPSALHPDGFLRQCLRNGGEMIDGSDG